MGLMSSNYSCKRLSDGLQTLKNNPRVRFNDDGHSSNPCDASFLGDENVSSNVYLPQHCKRLIGSDLLSIFVCYTSDILIHVVGSVIVGQSNSDFKLL